MNELLRRLLFLPEQASTFSPRVDHLHYFIIGSSLVVGTLIAALMLGFLVRYRRRSEAALTARVKTPRWLEIVRVGVTLGAFLLWFAIGFGDYVWVRTPPTEALDVYVVGKQWMWKFTHLEGPSEVDVLHVPAGRPVRLLITSRDVIHSFFVPAFRIKQDAVPGRYTETWFEVKKPGRYQVLCAEYCGLWHSRMRAEVVALEPAEFERWRQDVGAQTGEHLAGTSLRERGREVAVQQGCLKCHSVDGAPHIGPTWRGLYGRAETLDTGERVVATEAYLTESMMDPMARIVAGFRPLMPSYRGTLSEGETAALLEYIRSLRGDDALPAQSKEPVYAPAR